MHPASAHSLLARDSAGLRPYLVSSGVAHLVVLVLGLGYSYFASPVIDLNQQPIRATLVRRGAPRDEQLLPRKEELPPPPKESAGEQPAVPIPAPASKAVPVPVPGIKQISPAASKRPGEADGEDRRKQLFGAFSKTGKKVSSEELAGQADGDPMGDSATAEGERYWGLLSAQVRRNYDVSQTIPDEERVSLKAQVVLKIGRKGEVLRSALAKPSGNSLFDNAVLLAVKKAAPFSPPPDHLRASLESVGVVLEFRP